PMRAASRGPASASPAATALTGVRNRADTEHALDPVPVRCAVRRHGAARERALDVCELHHRREGLAAIVREEKAVSVNGKVRACVDSLRLAKTLPEAAQVRRWSRWQEVGGACGPQVQLAAGSSGVERTVACVHEGSELAADVEKGLQALTAVGRDDNRVGDSGELANVHNAGVHWVHSENARLRAWFSPEIVRRPMRSRVGALQ